MPTTLLLAPAAAGKTQVCVERVCASYAQAPLTPIWIIVPDRNQGMAFQRRLAGAGGALGSRVATFGDLHAEILALAGTPYPLTPEAVIHRLVRLAVDEAAAAGRLSHYQPIQRRPGFVRLMATLIAELKRAQINPQQFGAAVAGRGARLEELATLYAGYQSALLKLEWSDHEGRGWLAAAAVQRDISIAADWTLLVVDGFDSFNPTQLTLLELLAARVPTVLLTLTGDKTMTRPAFRRFANTLRALQRLPGINIETLPPRKNPVPALAHLEAHLFASDAAALPTGDHVTFIEAQNMALEAREALRWLKARMVRNGLRPRDCAVVARDLTPYHPFLRQAAREFGLPLRLASREPLAQSPAVAAVLNLLELPLRDWARRPLLDVLRTPYFDLSAFGFSASDPALLDVVARSAQVIGGLEQWCEALARLAATPGDESTSDDDADPTERPPQPPRGQPARELWARLQAFAEKVTPPDRDTIAGYARWLEALISDQEGLRLVERAEAQQDTAPRDKAALEAFSRMLGALMLGEMVVGRAPALSYAEFHGELRGIVEAAGQWLEPVENRKKGQIFASDLANARGVTYRAVALLGLSEGLFPAAIQEDPLLSEDEREALRQAGLPLESRLRSDQQTLFYEGVTRAGEYLLLTRPYLANDGESWEPSPYWEAARRLFKAEVRRVRPADQREHHEAGSPLELLSWSVRAGKLNGAYREEKALLDEWEMLRHAGALLKARLDGEPSGAYEGDLSALSPQLAARFGADHIWSASRLESYGGCPFNFFISYGLKLEETQPPVPGFDPAQLGSMLHEILDITYRRAADTTDAEQLLAHLEPVARQVYATAPEKYGFRPTPLWHSQQREMLRWLNKAITALAQPGRPFRPSHFELKFGRDGQAPLSVPSEDGPILMGGFIDRVDCAEDGGLCIIDYKTGSSGMHASELIEGRRLQLPLYSLAAQHALGLGQPVDGFYWSIISGQESHLRLAGFRYTTADGVVFEGPQGAIAMAVEHVINHVRGVRAGRFIPTPPSDGCKGYCPARLFCWRYQVGGRPS